MKVEEIKYSIYGKCLRLTYGEIQMIVSLSIGPRIVSLTRNNSANVFYNDTEDKNNGEAFAKKTKEAYGQEYGIWHNYGGHRLWASPEQAPRTAYPDNFPIDYKIKDNKIRLIQPIQKWTNISIEIELEFIDNSTICVNHKITNNGAWPIEFSPWALSVLDGGGTEIIPLPDNKTGFLANNWISLWSYCRMNDKRIYWGDKFITVKQDKNCKNPLKLGIKSYHGYGAYLNNNTLFVKYFEPHYENGVFPDGGMNFETYTDNCFIEMETLGEYKKIDCGKKAVHKEIWKIFDNVKSDLSSEKKIEEIVNKYILD